MFLELKEFNARKRDALKDASGTSLRWAKVCSLEKIVGNTPAGPRKSQRLQNRRDADDLRRAINFQ